MTWHWLIIAGVVRFIFLLAPLKVEREFALSGSDLDEAREFVNASSCKGMLVSLPAVFFVNVMAEADKTCSTGISPLWTTLYVIAGIAMCYGALKVPAAIYRGTFVPFVWFVVLTLIDVVTQAFALTPAVHFVCKQ
jgi:hypothetical protein